MSWRHAPLYVEAHAIAVDLVARAARWPAEHRVLGQRVAGAALDLVDAVALSLTFPDRRDHHLRAADEAVVRLRMGLRVARDVGLMSPGAVRHVTARMAAAGRMIGGWRRHTDRGTSAVGSG